ncbi:Versicolorin B synthase [Cytospora mali]|uniref:Versicolorin B synthase n=1 Tax=Cytospora mali TaxID=578113 RepID=A0A194VPS3_CYTMA|nr:Versicolorin B synthase [Valsa mali]
MPSDMKPVLKGIGLTAVLVAGAQASAIGYNPQVGGLVGSSFGVAGKNATYDYVVVGGGTAGLTIATRLVEQGAGTVAVIEAGSFYEMDNGNISQVPATDSMYITKAATDWQPLIDWGYESVPQRGADDIPMHYARGKCLGGSSARNYMAYQIGTTDSYKMWSEAVGDNSYELRNFDRHFKKSITFTPPRTELRFPNATPIYDRSTIQNTSGPLALSFPNYAQAFATWVVQGLKEIGIPIIPGFLSGELLGQSYVMTTIDAATGIRATSEAFLQAALK